MNSNRIALPIGGTMPSLRFLATLAIGLAVVVVVSNAKPAKVPELRDPTCNDAGWYYYNGHCYLIDPIGTGTMTWQQAADFCPNANSSERFIK